MCIKRLLELTSSRKAFLGKRRFAEKLFYQVHALAAALVRSPQIVYGLIET